jgi:UDP:flavonoid glycosyltransferase YjiC (YdhE family)
VFLSHAGMGSAVQALWSGVPVLAVPQVFDQPVIAERLVELGVGRHLHREDVTPAVMRDAVESLTAPVVRARAAELREQVRSTGGAATAAEAVEELLAALAQASGDGHGLP